MIKKYVMLISAILVILMFTSTSSASFLSPKGKIYEMLPENSPLKNILDRFSQVIVSNNDNSLSIDDDIEDDETDDDDGEYDDGEHDDEIDPDGPDKKGVDNLLPNVLEEGFYWTPDGGNEPVVEPSNTIDTPDGYEDVVSSDDGAIDYPDGVASNEITTDEGGEDEVVGQEGKWTVDHDGEGGTLERFVKKIMNIDNNGKLGVTLQRVIKRTVSTNENDISSQGSGSSAENNIVDNVVVTDGDQ